MSRVETIGDCTLHVGDCRDIISQIAASDIVVTDPPWDQAKGIAGAEVAYLNDDEFGNVWTPGVGSKDDPEKRWREMREWCISKLRPVEITALDERTSS